MQTTPTVQILALAAAIIMLVGGALIVYRRSTGWGPATLSAFGLVLLVPTILILAVTNAVEGDPGDAARRCRRLYFRPRLWRRR